jgi:hypothetical protein
MAIVALIMMAPLPLLMRKRLCRCQASIVTLIACCQADIIALVMMALLPLMHRHLCHCCDCKCHPHNDGIVTIVDAQASLPLPSWHCHPHNNGTIALDLGWCCPPCCNGVVAILKLASLPLLQWRHHHHQCCCPCCSLSSWCHCPCCYGIIAIDAQASLPLLQLQLLLLSQ